MGLAPDQFYDPERIAILPMAFCFPGYSAQGADLPPPKICAATWRAQMLARYSKLKLQLLVGGYAQKWHLNTKASLGQVMAQWRRELPAILPLPHPSWRNNAWLKKNPWFEADLLPELQRRVKELMR
jgi:uracil-DNA glycosylase